MDSVLSYNFGEIEYSVRQEIHTTSARFNAALDELRSQIAPLQQLWTREAAAAYQVEQLKWHQAATALNEILVDLGMRYATARTRWPTPIAGRPASGDGSRGDRRCVVPVEESRRDHTVILTCGDAHR